MAVADVDSDLFMKTKISYLIPILVEAERRAEVGLVVEQLLHVKFQ
jgi:hypothetical protein